MFLHLSSEIIEGSEGKETYLHRAIHIGEGGGGGRQGGQLPPPGKLNVSFFEHSV